VASRSPRRPRRVVRAPVVPVQRPGGTTRTRRPRRAPTDEGAPKSVGPGRAAAPATPARGVRRSQRHPPRCPAAGRRSGILLVLLGVLCGLGIYADAAGPVGEVLSRVSLGLLGLVGYAVPPLLVWLGAAIVIGRAVRSRSGRVVGGAMALLLLGVLVPAPGAPADPSDGMAGPVAARGTGRLGDRGSPGVGPVAVGRDRRPGRTGGARCSCRSPRRSRFADVFGAFRRARADRSVRRRRRWRPRTAEPDPASRRRGRRRRASRAIARRP
jgi:hypothetical protein